MNRAALIQFVPIALFGIACSSLLGIEEIYEGPQNASSGGTGGGSGGADGSGGVNTGSPSAGGSGGNAGVSNAGGSGGSGVGGDAGGAGMGEGGEGAADGTGGAATGTGGTTGTGGGGGIGGTGGETSSGGTGGIPGDTTVRGKVVNHWLQPISGITVMIGSQEAQTASDGRFEIADVPEEYDAMMIVRYRRYGNNGPEYGWVYQGLTRRDPTLQVYAGLSLRSANIEFTPQNVDLSGNPRILGTALGGAYGAWYREGTSAVSTSTTWHGPDTVTASAHGLLWEETSGLPTSYVSYDTLSAPIALTDSTGTTQFELDLADSAVDSGTISGSVTSPTTDDRENRVFVRFTSNAVIPVIQHYGASLMADFTYTVPSLPNASITVAASEGTAFFGAAAVAHRDSLSPGQDDINLTIPSPSVLNAPANGTTLSDDTVFSWSGDAQTYVWHAESDAYYEGIYIVTANKQVTIPEFPNGWELRREQPYYWRVETHGSHASVDEMTGTAGFIDEFGPSQGDEPEGPRRSSGSFTISISRTFDTP